jgi:hypothetical protein
MPYPKIVRGFKGCPIKVMPCCGRKCVGTWDMNGERVWVILKSWDKNPIFTPKVHKRHYSPSGATRARLRAIARIPDDDFRL